MSAITTILALLIAMALALLLAFLPVRVAIGVMSHYMAAPIRDFVQRQRERRSHPRHSPDRRGSA